MDVSPKDQGYVSDKETRRSAFLAATLASFLTPFMASSVNVALPAIGKSLSLDAVSLSWVAMSYLLAAAVGLVPAGRTADLKGRKKVFVAGTILYTLASGLCALAQTPLQLIVFRILQGGGGAMIFSTGMAILTSVFPPAERGRILGFNVSAVYLGLSLGPFIGGMLTDHLGWWSVFAINVPLGLAVIVYTLAKMKGEWRGGVGEGFDLIGTLLYGSALISLMYGFSRLQQSTGVYLVLCGVVVFLCFGVWEYRARSPVLDIRLIAGNRVFAFSNLAALINYAATFGVTFLLSMYLQYVKGFDAKTAGVILIAQPVVMAALSPLAGKMSDRIEPRVVASIGMGMTMVGLLVLSVLQEDSTVGAIVVGLMILGAGFALFSSPNANAVMDSVDRTHYGTASAVSGTMRLVGQVMSMGIVTVLIALNIGSVKITPENHTALVTVQRTAFMLFAVLCAGGVFASLSRGNVRKTPD